MDKLYTAEVTSVGGRSGSLKSSDGVINLEIRPPHEMGGPDRGSYTNPEQLFAAGYAACFGGAFSHIALEQNIRVRPIVTAKVSIYKDGDGFRIGVEMDVRVPGVDQKKAEELSEAAHKFCPYSKAIHGNVDVKINVTAE